MWQMLYSTQGRMLVAEAIVARGEAEQQNAHTHCLHSASIIAAGLCCTCCSIKRGSCVAAAAGWVGGCSGMLAGCS